MITDAILPSYQCVFNYPINDIVIYPTVIVLAVTELAVTRELHTTLSGTWSVLPLSMGVQFE